MRLSKLYSYVPVRQFVMNIKEVAGVKTACVCEKARIHAKYHNLTRNEFNVLKQYMIDADQFDFNHKNNCEIQRERLYKIATIAYTEVDGVKTVLDIHYPVQKSQNGYRTPEQVKVDAWKILEQEGFVKDLIIGGFERRTKHVKRRTPGVKHNVKVYKKVE